MKDEVRKAGWVAALVATLRKASQQKVTDRITKGFLALSAAALFAAITHGLILSRHNERAAGDMVMKLTLENSALRLALEAKR